jgi:acetoin utilization protein AcuC
MLPRHNAVMVKRGQAGPLLVFGPRSPTYDFGPSHPLTPRRFGPGIDLLRAVGAEPGLAPEPAPDPDLLLCHTARYLAAVKRLSLDPFGPPEAGIGQGGDNPSFPGMHEAGAMVAGGSMRAMEAILRGDAEHAFHPGGGLHHAMPDRASGFCIYDDPALAIAVARSNGLRVLYVDLDVHHGDGVQAIHAADPGVLTISFHESGRYLFPGTGFANELGDGEAAGTVVNLPFEPYAGEAAWLAAVRSLVPDLAAAFGPDIVVSQHGADSHAWDPLAHLRVTTTAMGEAARLVDSVAHHWAGGRWLSTGGGGYDAFRVVPRTWTLVWLAGAHRDPPAETPPAWRERWAAEAGRYGQAPMPATFDDPPNAGLPFDDLQRGAERLSSETAERVAAVVVPALIRHAERRGWWKASGSEAARRRDAPRASTSSTPATVAPLRAEMLDGLTVAPRVVPPADPAAVHRLLAAALADSTVVVAAISSDEIVGLAAAHDGQLVALGVAPDHRRQGLGTALLEALTAGVPGDLSAVVTLAERDPVEPLDRRLRATIARTMLERAGFEVRRAQADVGRLDPEAIEGIRR